jgi:hypothetical protein
MGVGARRGRIARQAAFATSVLVEDLLLTGGDRRLVRWRDSERRQLAGSGQCATCHAERQAHGHRTFRVVEGEPLPTSCGEDLYRRIFGALPDAAPAAH